MDSLGQAMINQTKLLQRFLRYVATDSQAIPGSNSFPSSGKQREFAGDLAEELQALGLANAHVSEHGYVYAHLPANCASAQRVAFLAHVDVAPCCRGEEVKPMVHPKFGGTELRFSNGDVLTSQECPALARCKGHTLVTSDGTTLLGADDKAGIAAIMSLVEHLLAHPEVERPTITICFTPDEEIGSGVDHIDLKILNADYAFTVDGGLPGEMNFETFTAWGASARFVGQSYHPGQAKGNMVNAARFAAEFVARIPVSWSPEATAGREPFIHTDTLQGGVESAQIHMILRGFSDEDIVREKEILTTIAAGLRAVEPRLQIELEYKEQYRNMGEILSVAGEARDVALAAFRRRGLPPQVTPIRGGTDGSRLSFMGVPTPNLFTGSTNHHSTQEWASLEFMAESAALLVAIVQEAASRR